MKRRTFLEGFGYSASPRVRQTSLSSAVENIQRWGYAHKLSGSTVNDYITIWKSDAPVSSEQPQRGWWPKWSVSGQRFRMFAEPFGPPSCRTVCLMVDASDEMFTLLAGVLAALIRRRALTFRFDDMGRWVAQAPEVLTLSRVRSVTGQGDRRESDDFPGVGAVVYSYTVGCLPLGASSVQLYGRMPSAWCDVAVIAGVSRVEGLSDRIRPVLSINSYSRTARARNGSENLDFAERVCLSYPPKRLTTLSGWARTESP
ncbi:hypothetical protein WME95_45770 [Sorangium sp. So ce327]|uniref:hypothetical protein n=1 Tax=unclassified Sorangium TaxID=2621164 RepID=UPI003F5E683A